MNRKKSPSKTLIVTIKGKVIEGKNATDVFVNSIKMIGPAKIARLNKFNIDGLPLIVPKKDYRMQMNSLGTHWFVCTHMSTLGKMSILERIGKFLKIEMVVEIESLLDKIDE